MSKIEKLLGPYKHELVKDYYYPYEEHNSCIKRRQIITYVEQLEETNKNFRCCGNCKHYCANNEPEIYPTPELWRYCKKEGNVLLCDIWEGRK